MFDWLRHKPAVAADRLSNRRVLLRPARVVRGRYDAAQTTSDNERHWDEYAKLRAESLKADGDGHEATKLYAAHRAGMDEGASRGRRRQAGMRPKPC